MKFIKNFSEITLHDVQFVGGKNASLGEMTQALIPEGISIPEGFAITVDAYWHYMKHNKLIEPIASLLQQYNTQQFSLEHTSKKIRTLIEKGTTPRDLEQELIEAYNTLCNEQSCGVAVRSSATAEDLPTASFAGQQETFLNVVGTKELLTAFKKCLSSLFTPRAIVYRQEKGFDHFRVALSVGVQKMIRSDKACSGVAFTLDTETGFKEVVFINGSWGLGEAIVQGIVTPDSFYVHKPTLKQGFRPIIKRELGKKTEKVVYAHNKSGTITVPVDITEQHQFCLTNDEILELARMCLIIEDYYSEKAGEWRPMDIEWAKNGDDRKLYIVQARPETVHAPAKQTTFTRYHLLARKQECKQALLLTGESIGQKIASGISRVILSVADIDLVEQGDVIVTTMTDPDWVPAMKKAAGIVTDRGGRTCHAAIVSRELGIPAIIGTSTATTTVPDNEIITLDCSQGEVGYIYRGKLPFETETISFKEKPIIKTKLMLNIGAPEQAFALSFLPVDGVGLARLEFIIANAIKVHPMALLQPQKITDKKILQQIDVLTAPYPNKQAYFVDQLAEQAGTIAAAFYPRPVIIRLSDFKSNEYRNLLGGEFFEPYEENPMIGLRGASRYYSDLYQDAFALECLAVKKIREEMGLGNARIMIPFVRTVEEAHTIIELMKNHGLERKRNNLEIIMMCEIPSNVILIDQFSQCFDGFSIGSNDLTQMTLGVDRDSGMLAPLFDERNEAVIAMLTLAIDGAHRNKKPIGICGQAPSDYPELAQFLIDLNIDSISLNPDSILPFLKFLQEQH